MNRDGTLSRREVLYGACIAPLMPLIGRQTPPAPPVIAPRPTDIRILGVDYELQEFPYRTPYQYGGRTSSGLTLLDVTCRVRTGTGKEAWGFGSMPLGSAWSFPAVPRDVALSAMMALAAELRSVTAGCDETGHPIDLFRALEPAYLRAADQLSRARALDVPIPKLCTLVVASPFDAALHDAYGKAFGLSCYETYGPAFARHDLSRDLGPRFRGEHLDRYVPAAPRPTTPLFHTVGAGDPLEAGRCEGPYRGWAAQHARGMDRAGRRQPFQDEVERRESRGRLRSHRPH